LAQQYGGLNAAAAALGFFTSVSEARITRQEIFAPDGAVPVGAHIGFDIAADISAAKTRRACAS
jgi:hypothetical protein